MKPIKRLALHLLSVAILAAAWMPAADAAEIRFSAAASMIDVIRELTAAYAQAQPDISFVGNFGSSGTLAKQIAEGVPADLFISANERWMQYLVEEKAVAKETVRTLAGNTLVVVGPKGTPAASLQDLPAVGRIALGSPKSVPAGQYAQDALEKAGVWEKLAAAGKLVLAKDVRQALLYADRGEVDGAFVYRTDAVQATAATILFAVPPGLHPPVRYPLALTAAGRNNPAAVAFYHYLATPAAQEILRKYGFTPGSDT